MTNYDELRQAHVKRTLYPREQCAACDEVWPCSVIALLDENEALRADLEGWCAHRCPDCETCAENRAEGIDVDTLLDENAALRAALNEDPPYEAYIRWNYHQAPEDREILLAYESRRTKALGDAS